MELSWTERVAAVRDCKALLDEGILTEAEFKTKKSELLALARTEVSSGEAEEAGPPSPRRLAGGGVPAKRATKTTGSRRGWETRTAEAEDVAAIVAVTNAAHALELGDSGLAYRAWPRVDVDVVRRCVEDDPTATWLLAEAGDAEETVIGAVCLRLLGPRGSRVASVEALSVAPEVQNRGVGAKLLAVAENSALAQGATSATVELAEWRSDATRFFEKRGYAQHGPSMAWPRHAAEEISRPTRTATFKKQLAAQDGFGFGTVLTAGAATKAAEAKKTFAGGTRREAAAAAAAAAPEDAVVGGEKQHHHNPAAPPPPPPQKEAGLDLGALTLQMDLAASISGFAKMLDATTADDAADATAAAPPSNQRDDAALEGLLGSLLKTLKTAEGKAQFDDLAARQAAETTPEDPCSAPATTLAAAAPRCGFVERPASEAAAAPTSTAGAAVHVDFADPRALTQLLATDDRFADRQHNQPTAKDTHLDNVVQGIAPTTAPAK